MMKKRIISLFITISMIFSVSVNIWAAEEAPVQRESDGATVICFEDGSKLTISPIEVIESTDGVSRASGTQMKTGTETAIFEDSSGNLKWEYTLTARFAYYSGESVACVSATYSQTIYDDAWSFSNGSTVKSGNTAYGYGTFKKKVLFVTTQSHDVDLSISCDLYGNLY